MERELTVMLKCTAPEELFGDIENVPRELWPVIREMNGLPCDGTGIVTPWCMERACVFLVVEEEG